MLKYDIMKIGVSDVQGKIPNFQRDQSRVIRAS